MLVVLFFRVVTAVHFLINPIVVTITYRAGIQIYTSFTRIQQMRRITIVKVERLNPSTIRICIYT